jgi:hypothetical protein
MSMMRKGIRRKVAATTVAFCAIVGGVGITTAVSVAPAHAWMIGIFVPKTTTTEAPTPHGCVKCEVDPIS